MLDNKLKAFEEVLKKSKNFENVRVCRNNEKMCVYLFDVDNDHYRLTLLEKTGVQMLEKPSNNGCWLSVPISEGKN